MSYCKIFIIFVKKYYMNVIYFLNDRISYLSFIVL